MIIGRTVAAPKGYRYILVGGPLISVLIITLCQQQVLVYVNLVTTCIAAG
jgi:hypothetical protein